MGPYLVGFDTIAHYVPTTLLWVNGNTNLSSFIGTAPLLYILTSSLVLAGGSVTLVFKVLPPVLLGFLGLSIYCYARRSLGWSPKKSMVPTLLGTLYFVALRVSWDAWREEIAVIFLFVALMLLASKAGKQEKFSWKRYTVFSLASVAVVLSNQVVAVLMLGIVLFTVVHKIVRAHRLDAARLAMFSLPAVLLFFAVFLLTPSVPEYRVIFGFPSTNDGWLTLFGYTSYPAMLANEAVFILYCFLPILPLALLSVRRFSNFQMRTWIILILIAAFIPIVSPSNMRLLTLLTYPLAFYVAEALSKLKTVNWSRFRGSFLRFGMVYLVVVTAVLSVGFMALPPQQPLPYFSSPINGYIYQIPSSMLQNTVPITDCQDVENAFQWLKGNMTTESVLITHRAFYGWALSTLNPKQVILYEYDDPANAATTAVQGGHEQIYLVWWINGQGWYGQPTVASSFHEVYESGNIAVYSYQNSD